MTKADSLQIGLVLPDVLGTYGDDGNAVVLRQRARLRGVAAEIQVVRFGEPVPESLDVYTLGGGEDTAQLLAAEHLARDGGLSRAVAAGRPVLAICAGLQVLGESFHAAGRTVSGLSLIDATTSQLQKRMIGEIIARPRLGEATVSDSAGAGGGGGAGAAAGGAGGTDGAAGGAGGATGAGAAPLEGVSEPLTGFANHMGATILGADARPLGVVVRGTGNTDEFGARQAGLSGEEVRRQVSAEGVLQGSVVATYMHGPVLARNPQLADVLLARALGVAVAELPPLEGDAARQLEGEVAALRRERLR